MRICTPLKTNTFTQVHGAPRFPFPAGPPAAGWDSDRSTEPAEEVLWSVRGNSNSALVVNPENLHSHRCDPGSAEPLKKPFYRLGLLEEWGLQKHQPASKKVDRVGAGGA